MKLIFGLFILLLFLSDCQKDDVKEDTLKQYFQCVIDDNYNLNLTENETTNIHPSYFITYPADPDKIIYYNHSQIEIVSNTGAVDNIVISFVFTPSPDEIAMFDDVIPVYKYNKFDTFFQPGNIPFLDQTCPARSVQPHFALSFHYTTGNIHWWPQTYDDHCNPGNPLIHNEGNFTITGSEIYTHKKHGKCTLITGTFEVTVFSMSNNSKTQVLKIRNGKFKLLVKEWGVKPIWL